MTHTARAARQPERMHRPECASLEPDAGVRLLLESNPRPAVVFAKGSLRILAVNSAMLRLYGWSRARALKMSTPELLSPKALPRLRKALRAQRGALTAFGGEWQHIRKAGSEFDADVEVHALEFGGQPAALALVDPVARHNQAETASHEERDWLMALIRSIHDEVWYADKAGHFTLVNPKGRREFRLASRGSANVRQLARSLEVLCPDGTPRPVEESPPLRALRGETVTNQEEIIRTPATGKFRHRQVSAAPVHDSAGAIVGSVSVVRDITGQKLAEAALRDSEQRYRMAVDFTYDWEYWIDPRGRCVYVSPSCRRITGYTASEFRAKPGLMRRLLHPADRARYDAHIRRCERRRRPGEDEWRIRRRQGGYRWIAHACLPVFGERGDYLGIRGSNRDVTDRKAAEEAAAAELAMMSRLQKLSVLSVREDRIQPVLAEIVDAAVAITGADFGNIQLLDPASGDLVIAAQRGFPKWWISFWNRVSTGKGACGTALERGTRIIVEDVTRSRMFAGTPALDVQLRAGVRAVQSTPLLTRSGKAVGIFSTHYSTPRRPERAALRFLDLLARQAADLVERAQSGKALRASEERLRSILASIQEDFYVLNREWVFTFANRQFTSRLGRKPEDFIGRNVWETFPRLRGTVYEQNLRAAMEKRQVRRFEFHGRYTDAWYGVTVFPSPGGITCLGRDITARKRVEEALLDAHAQLEERVLLRTAELRASERTLAEREGRFRQMAENVSEVFWLADADFRRMLYVSPAFETVWGRRCTELYRHPRLWANAVHPEDRALVRAAFFHRRHGAAPLQAEYRIIRPDGTVRWIADRGSRVRDEAGHVYRIAGVARDITEGKTVELALVRADRALRAITACNEALLRSTSEQELYDRVCRIIVETGGYRMAWVGLAEDRPRQQVRPVAWAGEGHRYLASAGIVWSDTPRGRGPTGTAIRTGRPCACRNMAHDPRLAPWRGAARKYGHGSSLAMPLTMGGLSFGALTMYASEPMAFDDDEVKLLMQLAEDVAFGVTALRTQATRQRLERQLLDIIEREQRRIGQDIHDGLGQRIASARLTCAAVAHRLAEDRHLSARSALRVEQELAQALEDTRHIARGLHPVKPGADSLMSALCELAASVTKMSRIPCRFACARPVLLSDHAESTHLYRIAQESVNNAVRHARPKHIRIELCRAADCVRLCVEDDGRGLRTQAERPVGLGLEIMRYRASVIGARFSITSRPGRGTTVTCELPTRARGGAGGGTPHATQNQAD